MFSTSGGPSGGVNLRSLLCFIPGLDRQKAWHRNGELRNLVNALSKEEIHTIRLGRKNTQFCGDSSSSDDGSDCGESKTSSLGVDDDEDVNCPPSYLLLPTRPAEQFNENEAQSRKCSRAPLFAPDIVILHPSDSDSLADSLTTGRSTKKSSLIPDDSLEDVSEMACHAVDSPHSESTWVSPLVHEHSNYGSDSTQPFVTGSSEDTASGLCTCGRSLAGETSFSDSGSITHSESCSTCYSSPSVSAGLDQYHQQIGGRLDGLNNMTCRPHCHGGNHHSGGVAYYSLSTNGISIADIESPLFKRCTINGGELKEHTDAANIKLPLSLHNGCVKNSLAHPEAVTAPIPIASNQDLTSQSNDQTPRSDVDELSSSTDSRSFSYVSAPRRMPTTTSPDVDEDNCSKTSETTFWSTDSEAESALANIISRDLSAHTLKAENSEAIAKPLIEQKAVVDLSRLVQTLLNKPATKRENPFTSSDRSPKFVSILVGSGVSECDLLACV